MTQITETTTEKKGIIHHARRIHKAIEPHLTRRNIITAKLAIIFGFLGHIILPKLALFKTSALAVMFGVASSINPFGTNANLEPICGNGTIEGSEICDGIVLANGVNVPKGVDWKCSESCQLEIDIPRFSETELDTEEQKSIDDALSKKAKTGKYVSESDHAVATVKAKKTVKKANSISKSSYTATPENKGEVVQPNIQAVKDNEYDDDSLSDLLKDLTKDEPIEKQVPAPVVKTPVPPTNEDDSLESLLKDLTKE